MPVIRESLDLVINPQNAISSITAISNSMNGLYKTATGLALAFAGITIVDKTWQSMKTAESSIIKLKTALQDSVKGVQDYERAVKFAAETPFPVEKVVEAAVALRAFQTDPFEKVTKGGLQLINVLGDMAGAMGQDLTTATLAFTRALQGEWEIMDNNFQINRRSIPKLAALTVGTKAYKDELIKFISEQKRFVGGMKAMANSMGGMLSNLKDSIDLIFMGISGVADAEARLKGLTLFDSVKDSIRSLYDAVSNPAPFEIFEKNLKELDQNVVGMNVQQLTTQIDKMGNSLRSLMIDPIKNKKAIEDIQMGLDKLETRKGLLNSKSGQTSALFKAITPQNKGRDGKPRNADETVNFLVSQTKSAKEQREIISQFLSQGDKLMQMGRIIGQFFKLVFDSTIKPIFETGAGVINSFLDKGQDLLSLVVPINAFGASVLDTFNLTNAEIQATADRTSHEVEGVLFGVSQNVHDVLKANMGNMFVMEKEFTDLGSIYVQTTSQRDRDAIEMRLLSSKSVMEKQMIIFAILMNIIGVIIKNKIAKIFEYFAGLAPYFDKALGLMKTGFFSLIKAFITVAASFWTGFRRHLDGIRSAFGDLMVTLASIFERNAGFVESLVSGFSFVFTAIGWVIGAVIEWGIKVIEVTAYFYGFFNIGLPILRVFIKLLILVGLAYLAWKGSLLLLGSVNDTVYKGMLKGVAMLHLGYKNLQKELLKYISAEARAEAIAKAKLGFMKALKLAQVAYNFVLAQGAIIAQAAFLPVLAVIGAIVAATILWNFYGEEITAFIKEIWNQLVIIWSQLVNIVNIVIDFLAKTYILHAILIAIAAVLWLPLLVIGLIVAAVGVLVALWEVFKGAVVYLATPFNIIIDIISEIFGEMEEVKSGVEGVTESTSFLADVWEGIVYVFEMMKPALQAIGAIITYVFIYPFMIFLRMVQSVVYLFKYGWVAALIPIQEILVDMLMLVEKLMNAIGGKFTFATDMKAGLDKKKAEAGVKGAGDAGYEKTFAGRLAMGKEQNKLAEFQMNAQNKTREEYAKAMEAGRSSTDPRMIAAVAKYDDTKQYDRTTMPVTKPPEEQLLGGLKFDEAFSRGNFDVRGVQTAGLGPGVDKKSFDAAQKKQIVMAEKKMEKDDAHYRSWLSISKDIEINTRGLKATSSSSGGGRPLPGVPDPNGPGAPKKFAIGEWNVPNDMLANIHKNEMIIPATEASAIRELFGKSESGQISGTDVFNKINNSRPEGKTSKVQNINIQQSFYGRQAPTAGPQMKSVASELAQQLVVQGD